MGDFSSVRITLDPAKWPTDSFGGRGTYNHIKNEQNPAPPAALWSVALPTWALQRPRAGILEDWWKDLSGFDPSLKGWKLTGRGDMPTTVLNPREKPHKGDRKLALDLDEVLEGYRPFGGQ